MESNYDKKIMVAIVAIAIVITIAAGSTFAYWQWVSGRYTNTNVSVMVSDAITMTITPQVEGAQKLYPISRTNCMTAAIEGTATVTVVNGTKVLARPQFYLSLQVIDPQYYSNGARTNVTELYARYFNYAVVDPNDTNTGTTCANARIYGKFTNNFEKDTASYGYMYGGPEARINSPTITKLNASGHPILTEIDPESITFNAPGGQTTTKTYKFWVWMDSSYTYTSVGDKYENAYNPDPMQEAEVKVFWSKDSIITQVR